MRTANRLKLRSARSVQISKAVGISLLMLSSVSLADDAPAKHKHKLTLQDLVNNAAGSRPEARRIAERVRAPLTQGGPMMVHSRELQIPGAHGPVRVRVHVPTAAATHPALVYMHGGGWVFFSIDTHDRLMRELGASPSWRSHFATPPHFRCRIGESQDTGYPPIISGLVSGS